MKQTVLIVFFAIMALGVTAQSPVSFQVNAGIGTSNFWGKNAESDTRIAYKAGVGMNYELSRTWILQASLNFVSIGARKEIEYVGKANMNEMYIQLPVMMAARLNLGKNYSASLSAGPYIAYGIGGKTSGDTREQHSHNNYYHEDGYKFRIDTFGKLTDNNMGNRRMDAGMIFGIHIEYHKFIMGAELQWGMVQVNNQLINILQPSGYDEAFSPKNVASFFTVGYRF
ncbi:porin family protein [Bacteroides sp. UBA939]|uniref:porin family protein n=1 Tax=Bacteroides sp. UBA939 TaxID=1946092 RepID=UPI0025C45CD6|nr:porin family protein [Bacteroides sp. UBA939]